MAASSSAIVPATAAAPADPAAYDLTFELSGALDRHLVFPLLEFLSHKGIYDEKEIEGAKIELLQKTNMVDYAMDVYCQLHGAQEAPAAMVERRGEVSKFFSVLAKWEAMARVWWPERPGGGQSARVAREAEPLEGRTLLHRRAGGSSGCFGGCSTHAGGCRTLATVRG